MSAVPAAARRVSPALPTLETTGIADPDALGSGGVFLRPGDWLFGRGALRATTLLGSCISIVLWSPRLRLGAMCHCLLPQAPGSARRRVLDGRYGSDAGDWFEQRLRAAGFTVERHRGRRGGRAHVVYLGLIPAGSGRSPGRRAGGPSPTRRSPRSSC